jgi:AmmeMemoRadiSam system protein A
MIDAADRAAMLKMARDAIATRVKSARVTAEKSLESPALNTNAAAFVTLHRNGELRGCIGHLGTDQPLAQVIPHCAVAAATEDPRFPSVSADEVDRLDIEISVLTPLEPISGPGDIVIGRHGLVVEQGWHRGLLLPQVATEWNWDAETFVAQTCRKAGLPMDAWRRGAKLFRFSAEVFSESDSGAH